MRACTHTELARGGYTCLARHSSFVATSCRKKCSFAGLSAAIAFWAKSLSATWIWRYWNTVTFGRSCARMKSAAWDTAAAPQASPRPTLATPARHSDCSAVHCVGIEWHRKICGTHTVLPGAPSLPAVARDAMFAHQRQRRLRVEARVVRSEPEGLAGLAGYHAAAMVGWSGGDGGGTGPGAAQGGKAVAFGLVSW